jgi:hypothetical protein
MSYADVKRVDLDLRGEARETERGVREQAGPNGWRGLGPAAAIINGRTAAYPSTTDKVQQKRPNCTDYRYRIRMTMSTKK